MADLLTRLQTALGDAYRVERELGGGGMSLLFLATEASLRRQVVIKLLPPESASEVSAARFKQEIELAAHLQHPNILPVLSVGAEGDLLFYVMPFVSGESLRHRLTREGKLPVTDAVRLLYEIADALAYAHAEGVVHRDVKPENILLFASHAVLVDFGVARAVTAARGGGRLTDTGVSVGTPAYMSPEQAAGERLIDASADVYSLAVVGYEMLAGVLPFMGPTARAVIAAHLTATPQPLVDLRPDTPPAVATAIARALAKDPHARLRTAAEFRDAMGSAAVSAAARHGHPARVVGLYALASVAVLGVAYFLTVQLGLPSWVISGAAVLLLIGFPIVVVTGLAERRRAVTRTTSASVARSKGLPGWLTWRRALAGGGLAFGALGVGTAGYMAMRLLGIGPLGTLVASGVLKNREPVILADFQNRSTDSTLGPSLTAAFRVDLSESPTVRLVDAEAIAAALRRMERPSATLLDAVLAREIAQRENVKAVVTGELDPVGRGYVLSASLVAAVDGHVLTALRETADNDAALIGALDRLSRKLRERIGESLKSIRASEPLAQVTTGSLDALRKYSEAGRAEEEADYERAAAGYRDATAIDTGFAMAYRKLGAMLWNSGASDSVIAAAYAQAFQHRDRLPEVESYLATADYYRMSDYDWRKAVAAYRSLLERDPENTIALNNLAWMLNVRRQWREAESLSVRAMKLGPSINYVADAALAQMGQGRYADAQVTLDRFARIAPHNPFFLQVRSALESAQGDYAAAERDLRDLRIEQRGSAPWRATASSGLAWLDEVRGKLALAARDLDDFMEASEQRGLVSDYVAGAAWRALFDVRYRNRPLAALKAVAAALARHPLSSMPTLDRPYPALAVFYAEAGRPELARQLLTEYERVVPEPSRRGHPERLAVPGAIALAEGRAEDAILAYRAWTEEAPLPAEGLFELGTAYERAGQPDSALAVYERSVSTPGPRTPFRGVRDVGEAHALAPGFKRLGELYDARGDRAKAREYYGRFVDLWKDADTELQPTVRDVRARIVGLVGQR